MHPRPRGIVCGSCASPLAGFRGLPVAERVALGVTALLFVALFYQPLTTLAMDWWTVPEAGHGLLLAPVAVWLAWKSGFLKDAAPNTKLGVAMLTVAVLIRFASGMAAELFTMRASMRAGIGRHSRVPPRLSPADALVASVPADLPFHPAAGARHAGARVAAPVQGIADGRRIARARHVPVLLSGNVIRVPGHELFVTEACSGLRSLTALLSTAVLLAAIVFKSPYLRVMLVAAAIPIAVVINGVRVFLTGFLVYFVGPKFGTGFMHATEGWLLFLVSLSSLGVLAWLMGKADQLRQRVWSRHHE